MMKQLFLAAALAAMAYLVPGEASAAAACPASFQGAQSVTCSCAASQMTGTVWGSGPYTTDSSVCAAALHAGAVAKTGGTVTVQATSGCTTYASSKNNGVTTTAYGPWSSSFYFPSVGSPNCQGAAAAPAIIPTVPSIPAPPSAALPAAPAAPSTVITCPANFRGQHGAMTCHCSPTQFSGAVWGTSTYTEDSSLCLAALHAGAVARTGGMLTVQHTAGCNAYNGTVRNGVATTDYGPWSASFFFPSVGNGACFGAPQHPQRSRPGR